MKRQGEGFAEAYVSVPGSEEIVRGVHCLSPGDLSHSIRVCMHGVCGFVERCFCGMGGISPSTPQKHAFLYTGVIARAWKLANRLFASAKRCGNQTRFADQRNGNPKGFRKESISQRCGGGW